MWPHAVMTRSLRHPLELCLELGHQLFERQAIRSVQQDAADGALIREGDGGLCCIVRCRFLLCDCLQSGKRHGGGSDNLARRLQFQQASLKLQQKFCVMLVHGGAQLRD